MKNWSKGDRVAQPTYGAGTLVEVNEHHTVIDFDEHGRRTFSTRLVTLSGDQRAGAEQGAGSQARGEEEKGIVIARLPQRSAVQPPTVVCASMGP